MASEEVMNFIKIWSSAITALLYCYYIASRIPKGTLRLISILPVVYLFIILPLRLTSILPILFTVSSICFLAIPRLLLFSFHESPIPPNPLLFIALTCLPVKLMTTDGSGNFQKCSSPMNSFFSFVTKLLVLALWVQMFVNYGKMHHFVCAFLYIGMLYSIFEAGHAAISLPTRAISGVEMDKLLNRPYISTSLQDFWGRRWNLTINNILRRTIYNPIRSISTPVIGSTCASLAALLVTFAVSGLMHEGMYFYFTRVKATGEVTMFFVVHGVCVAIEIAVKNFVRNRWRLHPVISWWFTMMFIVATAHWLCILQLRRNGVDEKILADFQSATNKIMNNFITSYVVKRSSSLN